MEISQKQKKKQGNLPKNMGNGLTFGNGLAILELTNSEKVPFRKNIP